jgi:hypothetical protein
MFIHTTNHAQYTNNNIIYLSLTCNLCMILLYTCELSSFSGTPCNSKFPWVFCEQNTELNFEGNSSRDIYFNDQH